MQRTLDISAYEDYKKICGLQTVDVGSRLALIHALKPKMKKKSGLYSLKKKQLIKIFKNKNYVPVSN